MKKYIIQYKDGSMNLSDNLLDVKDFILQSDDKIKDIHVYEITYPKNITIDLFFDDLIIQLGDNYIDPFEMDKYGIKENEIKKDFLFYRSDNQFKNLLYNHLKESDNPDLDDILFESIEFYKNIFLDGKENISYGEISIVQNIAMDYYNKYIKENKILEYENQIENMQDYIN